MSAGRTAASGNSPTSVHGNGSVKHKLKDHQRESHQHRFQQRGRDGDRGRDRDRDNDRERDHVNDLSLVSPPSASLPYTINGNPLHHPYPQSYALSFDRLRDRDRDFEGNTNPSHPHDDTSVYNNPSMSTATSTLLSLKQRPQLQPKPHVKRHDRDQREYFDQRGKGRGRQSPNPLSHQQPISRSQSRAGRASFGSIDKKSQSNSIGDGSGDGSFIRRGSKPYLYALQHQSQDERQYSVSTSSTIKDSSYGKPSVINDSHSHALSRASTGLGSASRSRSGSGDALRSHRSCHGVVTYTSSPTSSNARCRTSQAWQLQMRKTTKPIRRLLPPVVRRPLRGSPAGLARQTEREEVGAGRHTDLHLVMQPPLTKVTTFPVVCCRGLSRSRQMTSTCTRIRKTPFNSSNSSSPNDDNDDEIQQ